MEKKNESHTAEFAPSGSFRLIESAVERLNAFLAPCTRVRNGTTSSDDATWVLLEKIVVDFSILSETPDTFERPHLNVDFDRASGIPAASADLSSLNVSPTLFQFLRKDSSLLFKRSPNTDRAVSARSKFQLAFELKERVEFLDALVIYFCSSDLFFWQIASTDRP